MLEVALPVLFLMAAAPYDVMLHEENLMVPMRDGVRLATDIYRPSREGALVTQPLPIVIHRTPYDKKRPSSVASAEYFASHGFVSVVQDARGRFASEGVFTKYIGEGEDGYDAVEYLATLPYGNGKVAMYGTSYAAHAQANAAKLRPPHLETIVVNMGGLSNGWDHKIRNHGAFEMQQLTWAFRNLASETKDPVIRRMLEQERVEDWLTALPLRKGLNPLSVAPNFEDFILTMLTDSDYSDYFMHPDVNWVEYYEQTADIPMLLVSGWYDSYAGGTVQNYLGLSCYHDGPIHLLMGPWTHGGNTRSYAGEVEFGAEAALDDFYREFHLRWFDRHLKSSHVEEEPEAPVRIFVMGTGDGHRDSEGRMFHGGYWRSEMSWPLPETEWKSFFFHADGSLRLDAPQHDAPATSYLYDPDDPVPTLGGAFSSTSPVFESGAYDQSEREEFYGSKPPYLPLHARSDVVVFQTEPLEEPVEIVGSVTVKLVVSSSAVDTDFTAKLVDVYPPSADYPSGFAMNLTDGILRARYRDTPERQVLMTPGEVYELTVEPFPTANVFKKGHRIRVDISSSNFPRFDTNPNTGEPLGKHRRKVVAENAIYHDRVRASHIVLPLVPTKSH